MAQDEIPAQVLRIRENARIVQARLDDLASLPLPAAEEDDRSPGLAWPAQPGHDRDAVLQPPRPDVVTSAQTQPAGHAQSHFAVGEDALPEGQVCPAILLSQYH